MRVVKFNPKRHKKNPWITDDNINIRNKLYNKLKQTRSDAFNYIEMQAQFNRYRSDIKKTITHAKISYFNPGTPEYRNTYKKHFL